MSGKRTTAVFLVAAILSIMAAIPAVAAVHEIQVGNFFFSPSNTVVMPGDTVKWVLQTGVHTTTSDAMSPKQWDSGTLADSFKVVFELADGPGPFPYHCEFHSFTMEDTIFMASTTTCYVDADGDGFGDPLNTVQCPDASCLCQPDLVSNDLDCDDTDVSINPDAEDPLGDGIDQDCDGVDGKGDCCDSAGDANDDGLPNVGDAVYMINFVFSGGAAPPCMNEGDANADCQANVGDAVYLINFIFSGGAAPQCGCVE
jgi:plastocyanin